MSNRTFQLLRETMRMMVKGRLFCENNRVKEFQKLHERACQMLFGKPPDVDQELRLQVRDFLIKAMKPRTWESHFYRANPCGYRIEEALLRSLDAFDYPENLVRTYHLKQVRRFLFSRFNFRGACSVNQRLRKTADLGKAGSARLDAGRESWLWLYKDCLLPRMFFSIALGFGALFGSGVWKSWLDPLARLNGEIAWPATGILLLLDFLLIDLNVRNQIGRVPERWLRSGVTWVGCLAWVFVFLATGSSYDKLVPSKWGFSWSSAWLAGSIALLLGLLGQFFFGKTGSIADPL